MEAPFTFGRLAAGHDFTDRETETRHLVANFRSGINTVLISPRRWGKSSLVSKAASQAIKQNKHIRICFLDLYNVRSEEQFYQSFAEQILKASSGKWDEILETARTFLGRLVPKLTVSPDALSEMSLGLDWEEVKKNPDDILGMPEKIARSKKQKWIICIDEFQNIADLGNPVAIQKKLRSHWQKHQHVSYCLYGSKRNMMMHVFSSPSMPFYKFGDLMFLEKISQDDWIHFIIQRFHETGKKISEENAARIAKSADCHPYYVQQLAQQCWLRSGKICSPEQVSKAEESLVFQLSMLFQEITDGLSSPQVNFLLAILEDVKEFSAAENLKKYKLGTSANVIRIKTALLSKEIIDVHDSRMVLLDPMYKHWLIRHYFTIRGKV